MDWVIYLLAGAVAGTLSGLFGVGGGLIIVPVLALVFTGLGFPEQHIMHLALGTSLATIIFTSISSTRAHQLNGNVDWHVVGKIALGIIIGTLAGAVLATSMKTLWLKLIFAMFVIAVATQLMLSLSPNPKRRLPGIFGTSIAGLTIGAISSLVGIGGGTLSVPLLIYCNIAIKKAIGTSAAIGLPIAMTGTLGFIFTGLHNTMLPAYSFGYVFFPALICIAAASTLTAPIGARMAQRLSAITLKRAFAGLLYLIGLHMLSGMF